MEWKLFLQLLVLLTWAMLATDYILHAQAARARALLKDVRDGK